MKALLLKDFYQTKAYGKALMVLALLFAVLGAAEPDNMFIGLYPAILCSIFPVTLLSYDERTKWDQFSAAMPFTRKQLVSAKYLFLLTMLLVMEVLNVTLRCVFALIRGSFYAESILLYALLLFIVGIPSSAVMMPFFFKLGVEKGRILYYIMIGIICALTMGFSNQAILSGQAGIQLHWSWVPVALLGCGALLAISWWLSVRFYEKRELGK